MKGSILRQGASWKVNYYFQGKRITKCFKQLEDAEIFRAGLRVKEREGVLDYMDYKSDNPLGFENMVEKFLYSKRLLKGVKKYEQKLRFGVERWGNRNIKTIQYADIEDLITDLREGEKSSKYIKDIRDSIKTFYRWLWNSGEIKYDQIPIFPTVKVSMSYRKIIDKKTQKRILDELRRISEFNPRISLGVRFLATYINVRPSELLSVREKDIDLDNGRIIVQAKNVKTGNQKFIYLIDEDVKLIKSLGPSFGNMYFFRHTDSRGGVKPGARFAKDLFYRYWKKACRNLGIKGVDLYGGTRHSSAVALRQKHSPEAVRRATQHATKSSFDRYLVVQEDELRALYADTRFNQGEVVKLKK